MEGSVHNAPHHLVQVAPSSGKSQLCLGNSFTQLPVIPLLNSHEGQGEQNKYRGRKAKLRKLTNL